ncbi:MAG: SH3 domain-containing protein [Lachnospiraceae bacterium]|nr:SH3 domain-containing protein [Lachnospiraceae bacterium]
MRFRRRLARRIRHIKRFLARNTRIVMPLSLIVALGLTLGIGLWTHQSRTPVLQPAEQPVEEVVEEETEEEIVLEKNAYEDVNALFRQYYDATADGDVSTIEALSSELAPEEKIRITEVSKYIDSYPQIDVYTKKGPEEGSYVAYVVTWMKFLDHDWKVPGLQTIYVCTREDGTLYINSAEDQPRSVADYIAQVSVEDDVVDLNNQVTADYNELVSSDESLYLYLNELSSNIDLSVGQALAAMQKASQPQSSESTGEVDEDGLESGKTYLRALDIVNIRMSDSAESERLGQVVAGSTFELIEQQDNGWSRIRFNGSEAFVKSEFFEVIHKE